MGDDALRPRRVREPLLRRAQPLEPGAGAVGAPGVRRGRRRHGRDQHLRRAPLQARARTGSRPRSPRSTARARASRARRRTGRALVAGSMGPLGKPLGALRQHHVRRTRWTPTASRPRACWRAASTSSWSRPCRRSTRPGRAFERGARPQRRCRSSVSLTFNGGGHDVLRRQAGGRGEAPLEDWDVPWSAPTAARDRSRCWRRCSAWPPRRTRIKVSADAQRRRARRWWTAATSTLHARVHGARYARRFIAAGRQRSSAAAAARRPRTSATSCARCAWCSRRAQVVAVVTPVRRARTPAPVPREEKSPLARKLGKQFVVSVELDPPKGADPGRHRGPRAVLQGERGRRHQRGRRPARLGAHERAVAVRPHAEQAWASTRSCTTPAATGTCSGIQSGPARRLRAGPAQHPGHHRATRPSSGDYPDATAVYDVDSIGLIRIMDHLNHGCDLAGNPIGPALGPPHRLRRRSQQGRTGRRRSAGSRRRCKRGRRVHHDAARLRPAARWRRFLVADQAPQGPGAHRHPAARTRTSNAEFLHNEVPGMSIPEDIRERMQRGRLRRAGPRRGRAASRRRRCWPRRELAQGAYIMPPFNKVELAVRVIRSARLRIDPTRPGARLLQASLEVNRRGPEGAACVAT